MVGGGKKSGEIILMGMGEGRFCVGLYVFYFWKGWKGSVLI